MKMYARTFVKYLLLCFTATLLPSLLYRSLEIWRCASMLVLQMLNRDRRPHLR